MKLPKGLTEQQTVDIINNVANKLASKFKFGYHDIDDMKQQARLHAIKIINSNKWDGIRPLENFLYVCVHNLLFNDKRNDYERPDKPCYTCPLYDQYCQKSSSQCVKYMNKEDCNLYSSWSSRNTSKKNIMKPIDISNIRDENEDNMKTDGLINNLEQREVWGMIDDKLDVKYRADYLKLRYGIKIAKHRKKAVEQAILNIFKDIK